MSHSKVVSRSVLSYITKLLKLAQNDMVVFYVLKNVLLCPPSPSTGDALAPPPLLVASMLAPPASAYAGLRNCVWLTVKFKTFFPEMLAALVNLM